MLIGVCGGIAAYKVCEVVSGLAQRGVAVSVAMTKAARKFVGPVTFQALSGNPVLTSLWHADADARVRHVSVTDIADLLIIAPATADIIGKIAAGIADELVSTLVVGTASPVLLAPAMNERMWANAVVQRNVAALTLLGFKFVGPGVGWLACGAVGAGRMAEPEEILDAAVSMLKVKRPKAATSEQ